MTERSFAVFCAVWIGMVTTSGALAQDVSSFESLPVRGVLLPGDEIRVTSLPDEALTGTLVEVTENGIVVQDGTARRDFRPEDVVAIERRRPDSILDGTLIGAGAGAAIGLVASLACRNSNDCEGPAAGSLLVALWSGVGAGAGAVVDSRLRSYETVFQAPGPLASGAFRFRIRF